MHKTSKSACLWTCLIACFGALILVGAAAPACAQSSTSAQQSGQDYEQQVTTALAEAKKNADALNQQHKALVEAVQRASDPKQAEQALDDLIASATSSLQGFKEDGDMMKAVDKLLAFIEDRRKNAEAQVGSDPRWESRVAAWKQHAANIRQLREALLHEVDRSKIFLDKLDKEKGLIKDMLAGEGVARAKQEMDRALAELKALGDSLDKAVTAAQTREKTIGPPAF